MRDSTPRNFQTGHREHCSQTLSCVLFVSNVLAASCRIFVLLGHSTRAIPQKWRLTCAPAQGVTGPMSAKPPPSQLPFAFKAQRSSERQDFVPGSANEAALAFIDAWPQWPSRVCAIWGPLGSGKTHLSQIWRRQSVALDLNAGEVTPERVAELAPAVICLIDDADQVEGGAGLFHLINFVNQSSGWLLMTGKEAPQRWATSVPDLHSRLTAIPGVSLESPDDALIARVLLKLFGDRQLKVPEALISYLVPRLQRSFADAERIVELMDSLALQHQRGVSIDIAARALRQLEAERRLPSADNEECFS